MGPSGRAGPGTGPRTAAASGTGDGRSEDGIGKGAGPWHLFPGRGTVPSVPSQGSEGASPYPGSPLLGRAADPSPLGHTRSHSQELCVPKGCQTRPRSPHPGDWAHGCPQSHLCCPVGHRPRAALAEVLQALPGHGKDLLRGEQVGAAEGRDGTHGPLWEWGAWLSQAGPQTSPSPPRGAPCAHHADAVTGILQRPAQQLQHHLTVQEPTPAQGWGSPQPLPIRGSRPRQPGKGSGCPQKPPQPQRASASVTYSLRKC